MNDTQAPQTYRVHLRITPNSENIKPYNGFVDLKIPLGIWKWIQRNWDEALTRIHESAITTAIYNGRGMVLRQNIQIIGNHALPESCDLCQAMEKAKATISYEARQ